MTTVDVLIQGYVNDVLNSGSVGALDKLFDQRYVDHDPVTGGHRATLTELRRLVNFLGMPRTDIRFTLEDLVSEGSRAGYRLFGEGVGHLIDLRSVFVRGGPANSRFAYGDPEMVHAQVPKLDEDNDLQVIYECTGMFREHGGKLVERWGRPMLFRAPSGVLSG